MFGTINHVLPKRMRQTVKELTRNIRLRFRNQMIFSAIDLPNLGV